jgi:diguanylate cyclase
MTWLKQLFLRKTSVRDQQRLAIMLVCSLVLIVSLASSLVYDFYSFSRESRARLGAMADIIAADISAAMIFNDSEAVSKSLQALEADPAILQLFVLNEQKQPVAFYIRGNKKQVPPDLADRLKNLQQGLSSQSLLQVSPEVSRPITHDGVTLGSILVELDSSIFLNKLLVSCNIGLAILLISLYGSYLLARRLGLIITAPITALAVTMDEISRTKDYGLRAEISNVSELAHLAAGFNEMLDEVAKRDEALLERQERLHRLANYDTLTGLPNRALFKDRLEQALRRAERVNEQLAVMFIDLDDFKLINDTHGHRFGDLLLEEVARRLESETRAGDTLARLGGDEFIILLQDLKSTDNALQVAHKHLQNLLQVYRFEEKQLFVSASIGIALYPDHGESAEALVKGADSAMYHAKGKGKNHVELFTHELFSRTSERLSLQGDLRRALDQGEFVLHYQPRFNLLNGQWSGAEALIRWNHPQHGMISPLTFIPLAEETGLIMQLGEWVLREACQQLNRWHQAGIRLPRVSVNVSPLQFRRQNIVELVKSAVSEARLCTQALELEITESALMEDMDASIATLKLLQAIGIIISIDDFGTGYSSLSHLRSLPVDILKIDRSFIMNANASKDDAQILAAIISMAHSLHLALVAEGVECLEHQQLLQKQSCREAQGFYYARPMSAGDLAIFLQNSSAPVESVSYAPATHNRDICCFLDENLVPDSNQPELDCLQVPGRPLACYGKRFCEAAARAEAERSLT